MRTIAHRTIFFAILFFSFANAVSSQDEFVNYYGKYNADNTLKLSFIEHEEDYTTLYVSYLGTTNVGQYTSLYLNNLRIKDRETYREYKPVDTDILPTDTDGKVFYYNSGSTILIRIKFDRLPSSVKYIDVIEGDGSSSATYNFTFKNLRVNSLVNDIDEFFDFFDETDYYVSTIFTVFDATTDVYISNTYVGKLDRVFKSADYTPSCGEYGTLTVVYATDSERSGSAKASGNGKNYTWTFTVKPSSGYMGCHKQRLK